MPGFSQSQTFPWEISKGLEVHKALLPLGSARASKSWELGRHGSKNVLLPSFSIPVLPSVRGCAFALSSTWGFRGSEWAWEGQGWNLLLILHIQKCGRIPRGLVE